MTLYTYIYNIIIYIFSSTISIIYLYYYRVFIYILLCYNSIYDGIDTADSRVFVFTVFEEM